MSRELAGGSSGRVASSGVPDNAPPKWAFQDISAIRENTDRILELLDSQHNADTGEAAMPRREDTA